MALGAVDDEALTERVGVAIGREARALGVNVVYAPSVDLASEPGNSSLGIRSFGDDPGAVGRHGASMVRGLQSAGVAASAKHFPGLGTLAQDTHHALGVVEGSPDHLDAHEFAPFRAAIAAGAKLMMSAHVAVPALTGDPTLPATLSRTVMGGTLRDRFGFGGLTISDALDMQALARARPRRSRSSRRSAPGSTCSCARRTGRPSAGSRRHSVRQRPAACSNGTNWRPRASAWPTFDPGSRPPGHRPTSTSLARPITGPSRVSSRSGR